MPLKDTANSSSRSQPTASTSATNSPHHEQSHVKEGNSSSKDDISKAVQSSSPCPSSSKPNVDDDYEVRRGQISRFLYELNELGLTKDKRKHET